MKDTRYARETALWTIQDFNTEASKCTSRFPKQIGCQASLDELDLECIFMFFQSISGWKNFEDNKSRTPLKSILKPPRLVEFQRLTTSWNPSGKNFKVDGFLFRMSLDFYFKGAETEFWAFILKIKEAKTEF
ncbi:unnamed protein product [Rhizophagus irregularis]|nr:unnamed protein product [Rhizophagus irregularis]